MAKGVMTTKDLDRGAALTGVARQEQVRRELEARTSERELERAISAEVEKRMKAKSKRQGNAKKK